MINVEQTIISQYGNSATITQLIQNMNQYLDPRADFQQFYDYIWNVETAQGFGLDIWGRIVNIARELNVIDPGKMLGYSEALPGSYPFGEGVFVPDGMTTTVYRLSDDAYRQLILIKALANISACDARSINQLLQNMFAGRGRCYVNDLGKMTMRFTFEFVLQPYEVAILTQSGALPRLAGVGALVLQVAQPTFGFIEAGTDSAAPFNVGSFFSQGLSYVTQ